MLELEDKILTKIVLTEKAPFRICSIPNGFESYVVKQCVDINEYINAFNKYAYEFKTGYSIYDIDISHFYIVTEGKREGDKLYKLNYRRK